MHLAKKMDRRVKRGDDDLLLVRSVIGLTAP
jgi:hypothetical protein